MASLHNQAEPGSSRHSASTMADIEKEAELPPTDIAEQQTPEKQQDVSSPAPAPSTQTPAYNPMTDPSSFPDGGAKAWLSVAGGFCCLFVSFGWINCIGVFQEYYQSNQLKHLSPQTVAWIPSLEAFMMFVGGIWVGRVYDYFGPQWLLIAGTFLHVFGLMMTSLSSKYYQFILSQGVCSAIGCSMLFYPAMSCLVTWFYEKRAFAMGVMAAGSSLGGVIFPIMVYKLIPEVGFAWTMRICAFLILGLMVFANLTLKSRLTPHKKPIRLMDFIRPLSRPPFAVMCFSMFLLFLGVYIPFVFLVAAAIQRDVPTSLATYLVSIFNAGSLFGRTIPGYLGDKFGRFNVFVSQAFLSAILLLALWLPGHGTGAIIAFAVIFGFSSGCLVSMAPSLIAQLSDVREIGVNTGIVFFFVAIGVLIGSPIGGQLVIDDRGGYGKTQIFGGIFLMAGSIGFTVLRVMVGGVSLKKKV